MSGRSFGLLILSCMLPSAAAFASTVPDPPTIVALCSDMVSVAHANCPTAPSSSAVQECAQALGAFDTNTDAKLDQSEMQKAVEGLDQDTVTAAGTVDAQGCIHSQITSLLANADSGERQLSGRPSNRQLSATRVDHYHDLLLSFLLSLDQRQIFQIERCYLGDLWCSLVCLGDFQDRGDVKGCVSTFGTLCYFCQGHPDR